MRSALILYIVLDLIACAKSPVQPTGSTTVTTPAQSSPANGATIANASQPVTLTVANAVVSQSGAATYLFEVAADSAFANKVASKSAPAGANGTTSVTLDPLSPGRDYYWHARVTQGDTTGTFSSPSKFSIGPTVVLQPPTPVQPLSGASGSTRPTFTVTNSIATGPAGAIFYRFEVAASASFSPVLVSGTVPAGNGQTSFTPASDLASTTAYFWHAQAFDATNNVSSTFSTPQSFSTTVTIDLTTVNFQRFVNVTNWPITDQIIAVEQDGGTGDMCINHTMRGLWPTSDFLGDPTVQVEANQWYFANIKGQWYTGAGEWLKPGQICKTGQMSEGIGSDGSWGGPMDTWVPKPGDLVGYMITTPARSYPDMKTIDQRSNIVVQPWVDSRFSSTAAIKR